MKLKEHLMAYVAAYIEAEAEGDDIECMLMYADAMKDGWTDEEWQKEYEACQWANQQAGGEIEDEE